MKSYLMTTGALFGLLAAAHLWRAIAEWPGLAADRWFILECAIGVVAAALCGWSWRLLRLTRT